MTFKNDFAQNYGRNPGSDLGSDPGSDLGSDLGSDYGSDHGSEAIRFQSRYRKYTGSDFSAQIATDLTFTGSVLRERSDRYRLKVGPDRGHLTL